MTANMSKYRLKSCIENTTDSPFVWCYKYNSRKNELRVYRGKVDLNEGVFLVFDDLDEPTQYTLVVLRCPATVESNNALWLEERDDNKAIELLCEEYDDRLDVLEAQFYKMLDKWERIRELTPEDLVFDTFQDTGDIK